MPACKECNDKKEITVDKGTHVDVIPCEACAGAVVSCRGGGSGAAPRPHRPITFRGKTCPLCRAMDRIERARRSMNRARRAMDKFSKRLGKFAENPKHADHTKVPG